jgi:hypothetical protein
LAGTIVRGDKSWHKKTVLWSKLVDDVLLRLPEGTRAEEIVRTQREQGVPRIDMTDGSAETVAELRHAVEKTRGSYTAGPVDAWDMDFSIQLYLAAIDELIAVLAD